MRTLKVTVAYDGTRYSGWQIQVKRQKSKGKSVRPTIQGTLEHAFQAILREPVRVVGSGRTDAGVHALAQVAHARIRSVIPTEKLLRAVNHLLPPDIAITRLEEAGADFHARFDAARKRYRYRLYTGPVAPPFIRPYVHHIRIPLNVARMRREARALKGPHNFRPFARKQGVGRRSTRRTITDIALTRRGDELHLEVEGNGFLHAMVRSIAGTLVDVGRGRLPAGTTARMLNTGRRELAGTTAPAKGLALVSVAYTADRR